MGRLSLGAAMAPKDEGAAHCLNAINAAREKDALPALELDPAACAVAQAQADAMLGLGFVGHWDARGRNPYARYAEAGLRAHVREAVLSSASNFLSTRRSPFGSILAQRWTAPPTRQKRAGARVVAVSERFSAQVHGEDGSHDRRSGRDVFVGRCLMPTRLPRASPVKRRRRRRRPPQVRRRSIDRALRRGVGVGGSGRPRRGLRRARHENWVRDSVRRDEIPLRRRVPLPESARYFAIHTDEFCCVLAADAASKSNAAKSHPRRGSRLVRREVSRRAGTSAKPSTSTRRRAPTSSFRPS